MPLQRNSRVKVDTEQRFRQQLMKANALNINESDYTADSWKTFCRQYSEAAEKATLAATGKQDNS